MQDIYLALLPKREGKKKENPILVPSINIQPGKRWYSSNITMIDPLKDY